MSDRKRGLLDFGRRGMSNFKSLAEILASQCRSRGSSRRAGFRVCNDEI